MVYKKIAITGSTGGLGQKICDLVAERGAELVLVDRNPVKSRENAERLKKTFPSVKTELVLCDLESMESVRKAAFALAKADIDVLILNSGIYNVPLKRCDSGYNNVFQVNFVSQYFLARKLAEISPTLKKVIATSSIAHNYSKTDENDVDFSTRRSSAKIYGNSKRFLTFALYELFEDSDAVELAVYHPGVTLTNITNHYPKFINPIVKAGIALVFPPPKKAVRGILLSFDGNCRHSEWFCPSVFNIWGKPEKKLLKTCDREESRRIGSIADKIYREIDI